MATVNIHFSKYKEPHGVQLSNWGSFARKIFHSTSQSTSAFWTKPSKKEVATGAVNVVGNVGGVIGLGAGIAALCGEAALIAAGTAGFVAAVGGPQVAITAGVIGLALFVKSVYSDRESIHEQLTPYLWSFIDDVAPPKQISSPELLKEAFGHALNLMTEGPAQFKLMGTKLKTAEENFERFYLDLCKGYDKILYKSDKRPQESLFAVWKVQWAALTPASKKACADEILSKYSEISQIWDEGKKKLETAGAQGGAIFEFMRRLVHMGNYIQCAHLIHEGTFHVLKNNTNAVAVDGAGRDILKDWTGAAYYRERLKKVSEYLQDCERHFLILQALATEADIARSS